MCPITEIVLFLNRKVSDFYDALFYLFSSFLPLSGIHSFSWHFSSKNEVYIRCEHFRLTDASNISDLYVVIRREGKTSVITIIATLHLRNATFIAKHSHQVFVFIRIKMKEWIKEVKLPSESVIIFRIVNFMGGISWYLYFLHDNPAIKYITDILSQIV